MAASDATVSGATTQSNVRHKIFADFFYRGMHKISIEYNLTQKVNEIALSENFSLPNYLKITLLLLFQQSYLFVTP